MDGEGGDDEPGDRVQPCGAGQRVQSQAQQGGDAQQHADLGLGGVGEDELVTTELGTDSTLVPASSGMTITRPRAATNPTVALSDASPPTRLRTPSMMT